MTTPPCPVCLHHHHASDVPAEGRFRADGPLGYRPRYLAGRSFPFQRKEQP